jgi:hypothetical protein
MEKTDKKPKPNDTKDDKKIRNVSATNQKRKKKRAPRTKPNDVPRRLNLSAIEQLCASGLISKQVAEACGVSDRTFRRYKKNEEVMSAVMRGKKTASDAVVRSLFKRANGYEYAEVTMEPVLALRQVNGVKEKIYVAEQQITKTVIKHVPADQGAIEFFLTNREPDDWKKKIDVESAGKRILPPVYVVPAFSGNVVRMPQK